MSLFEQVTEIRTRVPFALDCTVGRTHDFASGEQGWKVEITIQRHDAACRPMKGKRFVAKGYGETFAEALDDASGTAHYHRTGRLEPTRD